MTTPADNNSSLRDQRDLLRGALATLAGFIPRTFAGLAFLFIAGRAFGIESFGSYAFVIALIEAGAALATLGMKRALFPFYDHAQRQLDKGGAGAFAAVTFNALLLTLGFGLLLAGILAFILWPFLTLTPDAAEARLVVLALPLLVITDICLAATRHKRLMRYQLIARSVVEPWSKLGFAILFLLMGFGTTGLLYAYALGVIGAVIVAVIGYHRLFDLRSILRAKPNRQLLRHLLDAALPVALVDLMEIAYLRADIILLGLLLPREYLGAYAAAKELATNVQKTRLIFNPLLAPITAQCLGRGARGEAALQLAQIARWVISLQWAQLVFFALAGHFLLSLLGTGFTHAYMALLVLVAAESLATLSGLANLPIYFLEPRRAPLLSALPLALAIPLIIILVPSQGILAGAFAFLMAQGIRAIMTLAVFKRLLGHSLLSREFSKPLASAIITALLALALNQKLPVTSGFMALLAGLTVLGVYLLLLRLFGWSAQDRALLNSLRKHRSPAQQNKV